MKNSLALSAQPRPRIREPRSGLFVQADPLRSALSAFVTSLNLPPLLPWQESIVLSCLATDQEERLLIPSPVVIAPRRNGKTHVGIVLALWTALVEERRVLWTAHLGDTARASWEEMIGAVIGSPWERMIDRISRGKGDERLIVGRGQIMIRARTSAGARGMETDLLILDEGLELTDEHLAALSPIVARPVAQGTGQILVLSSAGHGRSTTLRGLVDQAPAGSLWEYRTDLPADDREGWKIANPSLGSPILSEQFLEGQLQRLHPVAFAREHLGVWSEAASSPWLPAGVWEAAESAAAPILPPDPRVVLAVEPSAERTAVAAAVDLGSSVWVELVDILPAEPAAVAAALPELRRRLQPVAIVTSSDYGSPLKAVLQWESLELQSAARSAITLTAGRAAVIAGSVAHPPDPVVRMESAVRVPGGDGSVRISRTLTGDGWEIPTALMRALGVCIQTRNGAANPMIVRPSDRMGA
jgi:hypothetical protein